MCSLANYWWWQWWRWSGMSYGGSVWATIVSEGKRLWITGFQWTGLEAQQCFKTFSTKISMSVCTSFQQSPPTLYICSFFMTFVWKPLKMYQSCTRPRRTVCPWHLSDHQDVLGYWCSSATQCLNENDSTEKLWHCVVYTKKISNTTKATFEHVCQRQRQLPFRVINIQWI